MGFTPFFSTTIEMFPPATMLMRDFAQIGLDITRTKVPLKMAIDNVVIPSIRQNFEQQGRPNKWKALAEETQYQRIAEGYNGSEPILQRTGTLRKVATQKNAWSVNDGEARMDKLSDRAFYGVFHQFGAVGKSVLPARPFAMLQKHDEVLIELQFEIWLTERFAAHGFRPGLGVL